MNYICNDCGKAFDHKGHYIEHCATHSRKRKAPDIAPVFVKRTRPEKPTPSDDFGVKLIYTGFKNIFKIYRASFKRVYKDITIVSTMLLAHILYILESVVIDTDGIKAHLRCTVTFYKAVHTTTTMKAYFTTKPAIYLHSTEYETQYCAAMADIHNQIQKFTRLGSGWVVQRIEHVDVYISKYSPIRGRSYCKLPRELALKKAVVNVKNKDDKCFMWSVLAALYPEHQHAERVCKYKRHADGETKLSFTGISFPVTIDNLPTFEEQNKLGINVLGYGDSGLYPIYSAKTKGVRVINLLLLTPENGPAHYCWIKDLSKLLFNSTAHKAKKHICNYCLCPFNSQARLDKHLEFCIDEEQRVELPEGKNILLKFRNIHKQLRAPYVLYADCESFLKKEGDAKKHIPNSYGLLGVKRWCQNRPEYDQPVKYRGRVPIRHFLNTLLAKGEAYIHSSNVPMNITPDEQLAHSTARECYLCREALGKEVHRDHCHTCGRYRGAAHPQCNLAARTNRQVTVLFHNLRKYDGHLIMQKIGTLLQERNLKLECVARGIEDYMSFMVRLKTDNVTWSLRFVDSLAFLPASLETLVKNLPKEKLVALRKFTKHPELLSQKGFYPYDSVTGPEVFSIPGVLPIADYYNSLTKEGINLKNYRHVCHVYELHDFSCFGEFYDLYLLVDVLHLADVFENFRDTALEHYGLDPVHYITLPSFAWDALLKFTKVQLELLDDPTMYHFFSTGIRGGISTITHRHAKANNPYVPDYNPDEQNSYIMYLNANNLYGWAMKQPLPVGEFEWFEELDEVPSEPGYGYILEVDLEYPADLHKVHNDYPLAAERIVPPHLSKYCTELKDKLKIGDTECEKLIPNLMDKTHYIIHHRNLQQCLDLGMKLKKIHRGIRFRESAWMAPYIDFNTEMRKNAKSAFEKDLFKLLNNAVFGKSMENVFNYINVRLTTDGEKYRKLVASRLYKDTRQFDNDLHAVLMRPESVKLIKPIYTGFCILELSKNFMYDFHYNYVVAKYGERAKLLFTDTDSLCYSVKTEDIYQDMLADRDAHFDTSDYPEDHPLHSVQNKKKIGFMKDETGGTPIQEFVGLRAKMYSILLEDEEKKRAKGINKVVVQKDINHEDYKRTLFESAQMKHTVTRFQSQYHQIYTTEGDKTSLSAFDDKRFVLEDGVETLAYGHGDIDSIMLASTSSNSDAPQ